MVRDYLIAVYKPLYRPINVMEKAQFKDWKRVRKDNFYSGL